MKNTFQFKRHIPVTSKERLDSLDYTRKDDLYTILDTIYRKEVFFKSDYQNRYGYTQISKSQFKELIPSSDNLMKGIQFLLDNDLLLRNEFYVMNKQAKGYKIPQEFLGKTLPVIITDKNINKRIMEQIKRNKQKKEKNLEFAQSKYFKTFKIDYTEACKAVFTRTKNEIKSLLVTLNINWSDNAVDDIINCAEGHLQKRNFILQMDGKELDDILHRYMIYMQRIDAINDGFLFFKRNDTNGRLDTNLTSLPSFLRPFIVAEEQLMNIDIKNSQPYFLYTILRNEKSIDKAELARYGELVIDGTLYEFMVDEYYKFTGRTRGREQMKKMMYKIFFSKVESFASQKDFFGTLFPTIMNFINETNFSKNNTLAIMLQTKESFTILDVIMPLLGDKGIHPYTIHDSFVCLESESSTIIESFTTKMKEMYGIAPALHCDKILPSEEELLKNEEIFDIDMDLDIIEDYEISRCTVYINTELIGKEPVEFTRVKRHLEAA